MTIARSFRIARFLGLLQLAVCFGLLPLHAGSATWSSDPTSGDWNTAANWTPATVPKRPGAIATFDVSQITNVSLSRSIEVDSIVFNPGASAFTISSANNRRGTTMTISGAGIINNSGVTQNFVALPEHGRINFEGTATAGVGTVFTNFGGGSLGPTCMFFLDSSNAGSATIISTGGVDGRHYHEANVDLIDDASAANGTFIADPGASVTGGSVSLSYSATAANGAFICNGGTADAPIGGNIQIIDSATGADATFTINGTDAPGATAGALWLYYDCTAGNATLIANGGAKRGGGIFFYIGAPDGGTSTVKVFGNGQLDISEHEAPGVTIGSLEGDGVVFTGGQRLTIGSNNSSTTFSGPIRDGGLSSGAGGSLAKIGAGTLTLDGASTYTGGTTVRAGALVLSNTTGSAAGSGDVAVNGGTLGGGGAVAGAVIVGTGNESGATLQPSFGTTNKVTLRIGGQLTFMGDAFYSCRLSGRRAEVVAKGVTIESSAQFSLIGPTHDLPTGTTATVISNTSVGPIAGSFANLPDGGTITSGSNTFQVSYEGGDGNDLTLTVQ